MNAVKVRYSSSRRVERVEAGIVQSQRLMPSACFTSIVLLKFPRLDIFQRATYDGRLGTPTKWTFKALREAMTIMQVCPTGA